MTKQNIGCFGDKVDPCPEIGCNREGVEIVGIVTNDCLYSLPCEHWKRQKRCYQEKVTRVHNQH